jgi:hypothetical protein
MGTLNSSVAVCEFNANGQVLNGADGCYFLTPVFGWITRRIIGILLVFMITFLPPFLQGKPKPVLASYSLTYFFLRTYGKRCRKGTSAVGKTVLVSFPRIRSLCHSYFVALHHEQSDLRWSSLYRHRSRIRDNQGFVQHPLLSIRWPKYLPRDEVLNHAPLRDHDLVDPVDHILLGTDSGSLRFSVPVQSSSILLYGFLHRLSVRFPLLHRRPVS